MRALWMHYPDDECIWYGQILVGFDLLVKPVVKQVTSMPIYRVEKLRDGTT